VLLIHNSLHEIVHLAIVRIFFVRRNMLTTGAWNGQANEQHREAEWFCSVQICVPKNLNGDNAELGNEKRATPHNLKNRSRCAALFWATENNQDFED